MISSFSFNRTVGLPRIKECLDSALADLFAKGRIGLFVLCRQSKGKRKTEEDGYGMVHFDLGWVWLKPI